MNEFEIIVPSLSFLVFFFPFFLFLLYLPTLGTMLQKIVGCKFHPVHLAPAWLRSMEWHLSRPISWDLSASSALCRHPKSKNRKSAGWKWSQRWAEEQRVGILWAHLHLEPVVSWVGYNGALSLCWARVGEGNLRFC